MQALTLWQPFATLMAIGAKKIETRGWPMPAAIHGAWIAVHAASLKTTPAADLAAAMATPEIARALRGVTVHHGAIVAVAKAAKSIPTDTLRGRIGADEFAMGYYANGRHGWMFDQVIQLQEPVLAKGAQGIWSLGLHVESMVRAQLAAQGTPITSVF